MFCSTIIPTIGRLTLVRSVESVLDQHLSADDFEIIVVNDSGQPLPYEVWQDSDRVRIIETAQRERCVARNAGASIAKGQYLHFLDDDDWLLPDALKNLLVSTQNHDNDWICGSTLLVDRDDNLLIELRYQFDGCHFVQVIAGEWIPLQASIIKADTFFSVGGFNPHIIAHEDIDLCRRIALIGTLCAIPETIACVTRGQVGSTTDQQLAPSQSQRAREQIINQPGVLARMRASATTDYWHGRIARVYFTSMVWNLLHKKLFTAVSRAVWGVMSLTIAAPHLIKPQYWQALLKPYQSETFSRGFAQAPSSMAAEESIDKP
jgi:glycosyltransferase involved in cell wall biosynthesis